jgi:hypothetical protein
MAAFAFDAIPLTENFSGEAFREIALKLGQFFIE